jgi:hypothetical protein
MPNENGLKKMTELFAKYELGKPVAKVDYWSLPQNQKALILHHTACEKLSAKAGIIYKQPEWLATGQDGNWVCLTSGYLPEAPENVQWTVGEVNNINYPEPTRGRSHYPASMAEKRAKDRLVNKLLELAEHGIMSDQESSMLSRDYNAENEEKIHQLETELGKLEPFKRKEPPVKKKAEKPGPRAFKKSNASLKLVELPETGMNGTLWANWLKTAGLNADLFPAIGTDQANCSNEKLAELFNAYIEANSQGLIDSQALLLSLKKKQVSNPRQLEDSEADQLIQQLKESA